MYQDVPTLPTLVFLGGSEPVSLCEAGQNQGTVGLLTRCHRTPPGERGMSSPLLLQTCRVLRLMFLHRNLEVLLKL